MPKHISYNRGVRKRHNVKLGIDVFMYKDEPGVYRNAFGDEINEAVAKAAGFPVERLRKLRIRNERMAKAMAEIEADLDLDEDVAERKVVSEKGKYKLVSLGMGRHILEDPDGNTITKKHLTREEGDKLLNAMAEPTPRPSEGTSEEKAEAEDGDENPMAKALSAKSKSKSEDNEKK